MRIVSFLPSATEIVCALVESSSLLGVTHECDFPSEVRGKPIVVKSALQLSGMVSGEIHRAVGERLAQNGGESLYLIEEETLRNLRPELIITQNLCHVCAPSGNDIGRALAHLTPRPEVLTLTPLCLEDVFDNILSIGRKLDMEEKAQSLTRSLRFRVEEVRRKTRGLSPRPRVFFMEWVKPPWCGGHWIPEMVETAGGDDALGRAGESSREISWEQVRAHDPEVMVVAPCGFHLSRVLEECRGLKDLPAWEDLSCVRAGRVFAVDADSYFARPGPRLVDGLELLAHLLCPALFPWRGPGDAHRALPTHPS